MALNEIANIQITRETTFPSAAGFGTLLIVSQDAAFEGRIRFYGSGPEVAEDEDVTGDAADAAAIVFSQRLTPQRIAIGRREAEENVDDALDAIRAESEDFYAVMITSRDTSDQEALAAWTEANDRLAMVATAEADDKADGETGILHHLSDQNYDRTIGFFHNDAGEYWVEAAWFGRMLPTDPGSATWKFKTLSAIPTDTLTTSERNNIVGKNGNYYHEVAGVAITRPGTVGSGEWIDVIRGLDWLKARMSESIFALLINQDKVPYDNAGIAAVEAKVRARLADGVAAGLLSGDEGEEPTVNVPNVADVPAADRADRHLPDVTWQARLAGAIHNVDVHGRVSV